MSTVCLLAVKHAFQSSILSCFTVIRFFYSSVVCLFVCPFDCLFVGFVCLTPSGYSLTCELNAVQRFHNRPRLLWDLCGVCVDVVVVLGGGRSISWLAKRMDWAVLLWLLVCCCILLSCFDADSVPGSPPFFLNPLQALLVYLLPS